LGKKGQVAVEEGSGTPTNYLELQRTMFNPFPLWTYGKIDSLIRGSASHNPRPVHTSFTTQVANHLFQTRNMSWGFDLFAINIQRGRDHGIPPYFKWREICNLSPIADFKDMVGHFRPHSLELITRFYK
jgi:peroxidase